MIRYVAGDILRDKAEALVNTVNCVGVMGCGVALQFKKTFPKNFKDYKAACDRGEVVPGKMFITECHALLSPRLIVNFPTKRHWRGKSRLEDIEAGLKDLRREIVERGIKSIAIPALGSGHGGLNWPDVRQCIEAALNDADIDIAIYEPGAPPDPRVMAKTIEPPEMTAGRAVLVTLMHRYLVGLLDPFITPLELHKLMYFMQEAGEPLKLNYGKLHYGPYAENFRHVLNKIEGHLLSGHVDGGDDPDKRIELVPGAVEEAEELLRLHKDTRERFERVGNLIDGFETPIGLELLATVHWVIHHEDAASWEMAMEKTHAWNERKKRFTPRQFRLAFDRLTREGWGVAEV